MSLISCLNESSQTVNPSLSNEDKYFADYEAPFQKWGFIDFTGKIKIKAKYDDLRDFNNGLAAANYRGKWGYIDSDGKISIPHQYRSAKAFTPKFAIVEDFEMYWYAIDKTGVVIDSLGINPPGDYNQFYYTYVNDEGWTIAGNGANHTFNTSVEKIKINDKHGAIRVNGLWQYLNLDNFEISQDAYKNIYLTDHDVLRVRNNSGYNFINNLGDKISDMDYDYATDFNEDFAFVQQGDLNWFISEAGILTESKIEEKLISANEGFWKYFKEGLWYLVDPNGSELKMEGVKYLNSFCDGLISYGEEDNAWGYLNQTGDIVLNAVLPISWDFYNGQARIIDRNGMGMIDKNFEISVKPRYKELRDFNEGLARVQLY